MVRCAAHNCIDILLLKAFAPIDIPLRIGEFAGAELKMLVVHVTQRHHVFSRQPAEVGLSASPGANQGDVQLVAGSIRSKDFCVWKY